MADIEVSATVDGLMQSANPSAIRGVLELGTAATLNTGTGASNVIIGNDSRLTNPRTPTAHAASHLTGSDQIPDATTSAKGLMTGADKTKLDGIAAGANNYTLPAAGTTVIGGIKRNAGTSGQFVSGVNSDGDLVYSTPSGGGDVVGPASAVNNELALFDGTSGKLIKSAGFDGANLVQGARQVATQHSLTGGGALTADRTLSLVGDSTSPGNSRYYGTNSGGTKGFHELPSPTIPTPKNSIQIDSGQYQLVGDSASPGNGQYYGTNASGTRGYHAIPESFSSTNTVSGTTFSPGLADVGRYHRLTNASGCTITILQQSTVAWPVDVEMYFRVATAGLPTVSEGSGVTVNNRAIASSFQQHDTFALKRVAENVWDLI
jgi:hypothetical protein